MPTTASGDQQDPGRRSSRSCRAFTRGRGLIHGPGAGHPGPGFRAALSRSQGKRMSAVAVEGVWKFYGDFPALRNVRFEVEPGSCLALIGRNGAGKTTLLRIVAGFSRPGKGEVRIFGCPPRDTSRRRGIGFIGHGISVYDELERARKPDALRAALRLPKIRGAAALEWLERTGLARVGNGLVREFSRGMRQRLAVARAFLHDPACCCSMSRSPRSTTAPSPCCSVCCRGPGGRQERRDVNAPVARSHGAGHACRADQPRPGGLSRRGDARNGGRPGLIYARYGEG
jgi:hypothetical protein